VNDLSIAAVALGDQIERFGSYFGYAAVIGLGVLSLLYFAQAREVKRLREWAGRAPERDAELAQRVQADAQRRVVAQPVPAAVPLVPPASPQTVAAQQADAARKAAAAAVMQKFQPPGTPGAAPPIVGPPGQLARPAVPVQPAGAPAAGAPAAGAPAPGLPAPGLPAPGLPAPGLPAPGLPAPGLPVAGPGSVPGSPVPQPGSVPGSPVPQPGSGAPGAAPAGAPVAPAAGLTTATPPPAPGPPVPPSAANAGAVAAARQAAIAGRSPATNGAGSPGSSLPVDLPPRPPRSSAPSSSSSAPGRSRIALIAGGVGGSIVVVIVLILLLTGGGNPPAKDNAIGDVSSPPAGSPPPAPAAPKVNRKATQIAVLNGTQQDGLAGSVASKIEDKGFTILSKDTNADQRVAATTVSYAQGEREAAKIVARVMAIPAASVKPIDANIAAAVSPEAEVVVLVGNDLTSTG
jgi:hypothetical protein